MFRVLLPGDSFRLVRHLKRLDPDQRRLRFFAPIGDDALEAHVARIDWMRSLHIAYFEDGEIRGVAEIMWDGPFWPGTAEFAISVEARWQGRGIGSELTRRILNAARNRGIKEARMACLPENARMRAIARKHESILKLADGEIEARVGLAQADPLSFWQEVTAAWAALFEGLLQPSAS